MILIEVTLKSGRKATIGLSGNFVVYEKDDGGCRLADGVHNNGGWDIKDSYKEVINKIKKAMKK